MKRKKRKKSGFMDGNWKAVTEAESSEGEGQKTEKNDVHSMLKIFFPAIYC